jgi:hypothetical protein
MRQYLHSTLAVGLSSIHGRGLFLLHPVMQHQMLIEYTGELIRFGTTPRFSFVIYTVTYVCVCVCVCTRTQCCAVCCMVPSFAVARPQLADIRERRYMQAEGLDSFYFFRVDDCWIVDATKVKETPAALLPPPCCISSACVVVTCRTQKHNQAHCINHSCDPNCYAKILTIDGKKKCA